MSIIKFFFLTIFPIPGLVLSAVSILTVSKLLENSDTVVHYILIGFKAWSAWSVFLLFILFPSITLHLRTLYRQIRGLEIERALPPDTFPPVYSEPALVDSHPRPEGSERASSASRQSSFVIPSQPPPKRLLDEEIDPKSKLLRRQFISVAITSSAIVCSMSGHIAAFFMSAFASL